MRDTRKLRLERNTNDVIGSYFIKNGDDDTVGISQGYTIRRRTIICDFYESKTQYEISKRDKGYYFILKDRDIAAVFKFHPLRFQVELRIDDLAYWFTSLDEGAGYRIMQDDNQVGIVSTDDWLKEQIGIALRNTPHHEMLMLTVIGIAYQKCSSPSRFLKS